MDIDVEVKLQLDKFFFENVQSIRQIDAYRIIIGESPYPSLVNRVSPLQNSIYAKFSAPEIAFLSNSDTLDMYLVLGLIFGSLDIASKVVDFLQVHNINMSVFAEYLFVKFKVILVNRYDLIGKKRYAHRDNMIKQILARYTNNIILVIGSKKTKYIRGIVQQRNCLNVMHCSTSAYSKNCLLWCNTYLKRTIGKPTITIKDFAI